MAKVLINYIYNKNQDSYLLYLNAQYVLADLPVAVLDLEQDIKEPLVVPINNVSTVVDRATYESFHTEFHLAVDPEGRVFESPNGVSVWLPKDTDLSKLRYIDGQLLMVEEEPESEQAETVEAVDGEKPKPKGGKKK